MARISSFLLQTRRWLSTNFLSRSDSIVVSEMIKFALNNSRLLSLNDLVPEVVHAFLEEQSSGVNEVREILKKTS